MHEHSHDKVFDPERAEKLHAPERQQLMPTELLLDRLAPLAGQTWIDVGAGTGYYTLPLAEAVGEGGHVHAIDSQAPMLKLLKKRITRALDDRISVHGAPAEKMPLGPGCADGLLLGNCYHELADRKAFLREALRVLRGHAKLVIIDWLHPDDSGGELSEQGPPLDHRLPLELIRAELGATGLQVAVHMDWFEANYVLIASA